jgi:hypothetical protein
MMDKAPFRHPSKGLAAITAIALGIFFGEVDRKLATERNTTSKRKWDRINFHI